MFPHFIVFIAFYCFHSFFNGKLLEAPDILGEKEGYRSLEIKEKIASVMTVSKHINQGINMHTRCEQGWPLQPQKRLAANE